MAQLKDTVISGNLRVTDEIFGKHKGDTFYVKGTQTGTTGSWTGNLPEVDALYDGLSIDYWLPYSGSGNATLNLTLKNGTTTGAINCYTQSTNRLTTHVPQFAVCHLTYQTVTISGTSYTGWWLTRPNDSNDTAVYTYRLGYFTANSAVYRYQFLFQMDGDKLTPLNNVNNDTGTSKTLLTDVEFDPFGYIFWWNTTNTVNANALLNTWGAMRNAGLCDMRYTFNCGSTLTVNKPIYLKTVLQSSGKVKLATGDPLTYTLPSTNDGYLYIYLGRTQENYRIDLYPEHPIYYHDGTSLREYVHPDLATTSFPGLMSSSDKSKLDGIASNANNYSLPTASSSTKGGIKVGSGLSISSEVLSNSGVRNAAQGSSNGTIAMNINGTTTDIAVKGLASAAYSTTTSFAPSSHTHSTATTTTAGFMSTTDKVKLDTISLSVSTETLYITF